MAVKDWDRTPANNATAPGINWAEGMPPGDVNDSARAMMADLRVLAEQEETSIWGGTSTGAANVYDIVPAIAITGGPAAYIVGGTYSFIAHQANTGAATLSVSGLAATAIQYQGAALTGGEIPNGVVIQALYDGTQFQLLSPQPASPSTAPIFRIYTGSTTWTKPANLLYVEIFAQAPGGGGGGASGGSGSNKAGGGGGGGEHAFAKKDASSLGATETVTIGTAGTGGTTAVDGTDGGNVSFGVLVVANGGKGGLRSTGGSAAPGDGGTGGTGDILNPGQRGGRGTLNVDGTSLNSADGGDSKLGHGGRTGEGDGVIGINYGGGGSGGSRQSVSGAGANGGGGAPGVIIVIEHYD